MIALAIELRRAGHETVLVLSPNYRESARLHEIDFIQAGPDTSQETQITSTGQLRYVLEAALPFLPEVCRTLREACRNADVLVGSPYQPACQLVHETSLVPYISLTTDVGTHETDELSATLINPYRIQVGLPPLDGAVTNDGNSRQLALYAVSRHVFQAPATWPSHCKVVGFLMHDESDWQPDSGLKRFCSGVGRPVVVSLRKGAAPIHFLTEAAQQVPCRMIVQHESKEQNLHLPANIYFSSSAPSEWLFPRAALVVHHGDARTTARCLKAGVPAVIISEGPNPPAWSEMIRAKGCVKNIIPLPHLNPTRLAAAIRSSLASTELQQAATELATQIRSEAGIQTARKLIEEFVEAYKNRASELEQNAPANDKIQVQAPALVPAPRREEMPLSYAQQRLWFADRLEPGNTVYNMPFQWRFEGEMHRSGLQYALNEMVRRHEILRTTFPVRNGMPTQKITAELELQLGEIDLQGFSPEEQEAQVKKIAQQEMMWRFDLAQGPLWRMTWLRLDDNTHVLLGNLHHIVSDGWSQGIMLREINKFYEAYVRNQSPALLHLPLQYADYAVWQRDYFSGEILEEQLSYWRTQLTGLAPLDLPTDYPRPGIKSYCGGSARFQFSNKLTEDLKALARHEGATLFMLVLAALQVLLSKYSGQDDIPVGAPIAGRTRKELENVLGCFINMLTLRTDLSGAPTFREAIHRARRTAVEGYRYQDIPFEKIVQELHIERDVSRTPLFDVMLVLQNMEVTRPQLHGLRFIEWVDLSESTPFDFTLQMLETQGFNCRLSYVRDLYTPETALRFLDHLNRVMEQMVATPDLRILDFSLLTQEELHQVLVEWNGASVPELLGQSVHTVFEQQVEKTPSATAVEYEESALTYDQLNSRANQMAHYLRSLGVGPETPVALCMERCLEFMVSILGVLKAGGAYVPLDPGLPKERLKWMLSDIEAPVVLMRSELAARLQVQSRIVRMDDPSFQKLLSQERDTNLASGVQAENSAYFIYTSGSTGRPKAVVATHGALVNLTRCQQKFFGVTPQDRFLQFLAPSFDPAVAEWTTTLLAGATLVLSPDPRRMVGPDLAQLLEEKRISCAGLPPSVLTSLPNDAELRGMRVLLTGGAPSPKEVVCRWSKGRKMFNAYGPTEATISATMTQLSEFDGSAPIGQPLDNVKAYVLDKEMNPVPSGMRGELYVGGAGVTRGYWKRPDMTAGSFLPNPFSTSGGERLYRTGDIVRWRSDKKLEFIGRVDEQVKIREQRIELGEIETVLRQHKGIRDVKVIVREDQPGDKRLVAYVVPEADVEEARLPGELRAGLREELPSYMVPSHFVVMSALPISASGKIDRHQLAAPANPKAPVEPAVTDAATEMEHTIARVWSEVLRLEKVGVHDNFFDLGGDSFLSIRVQSELMKVLGREVKVLELFRFPTIRALAEHLAEKTTESTTSTSKQIPSASLDAGKERLKRQLAQRAPLKTQRASANAIN
jgi:amino acid adenylation domain-containing protein